MGYTAKTDHWNETRYHCDDCESITWFEEDMVIHVREHVAPPVRLVMVISAAGIAARMEQAGNEIRELREKIDAAIQLMNGGQSAIEAAREEGHAAGFEEGRAAAARTREVELNAEQKAGHAAGRAEGYAAGRAEGYAAGLDAGAAKGGSRRAERFLAGLNEGISKGRREALAEMRTRLMDAGYTTAADVIRRMSEGE